jgi:hypothetical protein
MFLRLFYVQRTFDTSSRRQALLSSAFLYFIFGPSEADHYIDGLHSYYQYVILCRESRREIG